MLISPTVFAMAADSTVVIPCQVSTGNFQFPDGKGTFFHASGDRYEGDWKASNMEGEGTHFYSKGGRYEGDWKDGKMEGNGTCFFANGDRYEGDWKAGNKEGNGTYFYDDGDRYEGDWRVDKKEGRGTYFYADGDRYEGNWGDDKKYGSGTYFYADGDRYEGNWRADKKEEMGMFAFADGSSMNGWFLNDVPEGTLTYISADGARFSRLYKNGVVIGNPILLQSSKIYDEEVDQFQQVSSPARKTNVFLSHDWGPSPSYGNHEKVKQIHRALTTGKDPLTAWFDDVDMDGDTKQGMVNGIDGAHVVVVFLTKKYEYKVNHNPRHLDNCKYEFDYAFNSKGMEKLVVVVMEPEMADPTKWQGAFKAAVGGILFVDFSKNTISNDQIISLKRHIRSAMSKP
jgi:hypothetical protein